MKKAFILYNSRTGITRKFAEEINDFLNKNNIPSGIKSIDQYDAGDLSDCQYLFLGCWTHGLMVLLQHPDKKWVNFAKNLPDLNGRKIILFTTYKLATGSMFRKMKAHIHCNPGDLVLELKSRNGHLNETQKKELTEIVEIHSGEGTAV